MSSLAQDHCYVVDDNDLVRGTIEAVASGAGFEVTSFSSGVEFLETLSELRPGIVLLDVRMPKINGIEVLKRLRQSWLDTAVIMISGHADIPVAVEAMQAGATDFVEKPIELESLEAVLKRTQNADLLRSEKSAESAEATRSLAQLTNREKEVLALLVKGNQNKIIAHKLGISARTVEVHRAHMMQRLGVSTFAELVRIAVISDFTFDG